MKINNFSEFKKEKDIKNPSLFTSKKNINVSKCNDISKNENIENIKKNDENEKKSEKIQVLGKVINYPKNIKPSIAYKFLESKNYNKNDIQYIIIEQPNNSISLFKYNEKNTTNLLEFTKTLLNHFAKDQELKESINLSKIKGNKDFVIIENISNIQIFQKIYSSLTKLLSKF